MRYIRSISSDTGALKLITFPGAVKEDMGNPIMASVSGTFPMALYDSQHLCKTVYRKGSLLHMASGNHSSHHSDHIIFTVKFALETSRCRKYLQAGYTVYVGIAVWLLTAPAYE